MSHSPEPWHVDRGGPSNDPLLVCGEGHVIASAMDDDPLGSEDFSRIAACVNFLAGFSTEDLTMLASDRDRRRNARSSIEDAIMAAKGECG
jgi:hypothetical protein